MVLVTGALTCVIWLTQSLRFIEMIVNRGLSAGTFVYLTMLLLPNFLSIILPIALFTVIAFTYTKLISDRELIIMQAAGQSQLALAKPALITAGLVVLFSYALNIWFIPQSYKMFRELQWEIRYNYSHVLLQEGTFNSFARDRTIYVRERSPDGQLLGILYHDNSNPKEPFSILAERGALVEGKNGSRVVAFNGNRQTVDPKTNQLSILYFDRYILDLGSSGTVQTTRYREARERSLGELYSLKKEDAPKDYGKFVIEMHKRLISPISALGFGIVALACLISGSFNRRGQSHRVVLAIAVIVGLQGVTLGLENASARNLDLTPLMYLNAIFPVFLGLFFLVRAPGFRNRKKTHSFFSNAQGVS